MDRMIIDVSPDAVSLRDVRVFDDFHVEVAPDVDLEEALTLAGAGRAIGDGDVYIALPWIRGVMAEREDDDEDWHAGLEGMLGYARSRGWISEDGDAVRSHVTLVDRP
jgi:hypothetical protein